MNTREQILDYVNTVVARTHKAAASLPEGKGKLSHHDEYLATMASCAEILATLERIPEGEPDTGEAARASDKELLEGASSF